MATKERPILFSAPMVKALLGGRKTQTRRIVKPQPDIVAPDGNPVRNNQYMCCPYGQTSDRLWVKETMVEQKGLPCWYAADHTTRPTRPARLKPSICMPRNLSRITLEITGIRVQHVEDISEDDANAEGFASREEFLRLFYNINKRAPVNSNPWVWCLTFKVVKDAH